MVAKVFDSGSGATLNQTANRYTLSAALATTTGIKTTGALTYGFSTSAKAQALIDLVVSMRAALIAAGIGKYPMGVVFRSEPCVPVEEMRRNAEHARTLGLPSVEYAGHVAVVGGGPSLADHLDELRAWEGPIWAINGTWRWLKDRGVKATFFTVDPKPQAWLKLARGESAIVATVGSAELFKSLKRGNVRTFGLGFHEVHSGVTSATAAPHLAVKMGHRSVTFFGCDSSFGDYETHVYPVALPEHLIAVDVGGREFATKPEFVMQAEDLAALCRELPQFHRNHSGGLLAALIENPEWTVAGVKEAA